MKKAFVYIFTLLLIITGISVFAGSDTEFSENENRYLTVRKDMDSAKILSGEFQRELTAYGSDQLPGRDLYMKTATRIKKLTGRKDIGGVYLGSDGFYFEKKQDKDIDCTVFERNLKKAEAIAEKYNDKQVSAVLVPESSDIYRDKLPCDAETFNHKSIYRTAENILSECRLVNPEKILKKDRENRLYYKTDHHWTLAGAYDGYKAITGKECGYERQEVCDDFLGSLYSKVLDADTEFDTIEIPVIEGNPEVVADGKTIDMFDCTALKEKDKYKIFFGGNYGTVTVRSNIKNGNMKKLLVIKDSFANCLVPLLTKDYREITMIDMRYYSGNFDMIAKSADEIMFVYQLSNFAGDTNISKIMM